MGGLISRPTASEPVPQKESTTAVDGPHSETTPANTEQTDAGAHDSSDPSRAIVENQATDVESPLVPHEFRPLELAEISIVNHNSKTFRFKFPDPNSRLKQHFACFYFVQAEIDGEVIQRPYTPISAIDEPGSVTLLVKIYDRPYGKMGNHIDSLKIGDTLKFKGPIPKIEYHPNAYDHIGMLSAGSGITPMYQVLREIWNKPNDKTRVTLLMSNSTIKDILLRKELEAMKAERPDQLTLVFTVSRPEDLWDGESGRIDEQKIRAWDILPSKETKTLVLVCGPPGFTASMAGPKLIIPGQRPQQGELEGCLKSIGFTKDEVFKF